MEMLFFPGSLFVYNPSMSSYKEAAWCSQGQLTMPVKAILVMQVAWVSRKVGECEICVNKGRCEAKQKLTCIMLWHANDLITIFTTNDE